MIIPARLQPGDTVATVTLSWGGPGKFPHRYEAGKRQLEEAFRVRVVEMPNTLRDPDFIKRNPQARADDLMQAFSDKSIKGIISTIGGDDSIRILPLLDLNVIAGNPKIFMGYSDTTATHFACYKVGLRSYYGPSIMAGFGESGGLYDYMKQSVQQTLFNPINPLIINPAHEWTDEHGKWEDPASQNIKRKMRSALGRTVIQGSGTAQGHLLGGCAELLEMLKGTAFWPTVEQWRGAILFIETSEEKPSIDYFLRWIRNLGVQGVLQVLSGIILARPQGDTETELRQYDSALKEIVSDEFGLTNLPILGQMDFGHTDPMFVVPYGARAEIDTAKKSFRILEPAVL